MERRSDRLPHHQRSEPARDHSVVSLNGQMVHDPHPDATGLVLPLIWSPKFERNTVVEKLE